jgi:predicted secreted hydrolase
MTNRLRAGIVLLGIGAIVAILALFREPALDAHVDSRLTIGEALAADTTGFARALHPRPLVFPEDHGPHPDFRTEWWYLTGNMTAADGRRFGYQFTIFRTAMLPPGAHDAAADSEWATRQLYMGHFALTDAETGAFYAFERFGRGAAGIAGARATPFRVWLEDWELTGEGQREMRMRLRAAEGDVAVDFFMEPTRPMVLQGEEGFSPKGTEPGNASFYYSKTRLATSGTIRIGEEQFTISGNSWLDREWSTSLLGSTQVGWDWFALHLDDGRDLMFFVVREEDPSAVPYSDGVLVDPSGATTPLSLANATLTVLDQWRSPRSGASYPSRWHLVIPEEAIDLELWTIVPDQELDVSIRYYEGALDIRGSAAGREITGAGYVEMTGYDQRFGRGR